MDTMLVKILVCFAVFSFIGWIILFVGIGTRREMRRREMYERKRAQGRIIDYVKRDTKVGNSSVPLKYPVVEFSVYEHKYTLEYRNSMDMKRWPAGSDVTVVYDGNDPERFHLEEDAIFANGGGGAIRIGIIWILCAAAATLTLAVFVGGMSLDGLWFRIRMLFRSR